MNSNTPTIDTPGKPKGPFDRLADYVSFAMGRPKNIVFWLVLVLIWIFVFAFGGPHLASGTWLPKWFTSTGFNFPLNLVTTVAELFIGFLVAAAANRSEKTLWAIILRIQTETDEIDQLVRENTELTRQVFANTQVINELREHMSAICDKLDIPIVDRQGGIPTR
jgi:low affinity Fe/Cu permease